MGLTLCLVVCVYVRVCERIYSYAMDSPGFQVSVFPLDHVRLGWVEPEMFLEVVSTYIHQIQTESSLYAFDILLERLTNILFMWQGLGTELLSKN